VLDSVCTKGECGCKAGYVATSKKVYPDNLSTEPVDFGSACVRKCIITYGIYLCIIAITARHAYVILALLIVFTLVVLVVLLVVRLPKR
jgi:hypothetical protein